jgi:hypothetical protein
METTAEPFAPEGVTFSTVSPRLAWARRGSGCLPLLVIAVGCATGAAVLGRPGLYGLTVMFLAMAGWLWWWSKRQAQSWGYAERHDDLLVRHGIMFRELVVVPYGRMQFVDVTAGPVDRVLGIARVRLHTASAHTDATIPGLPAVEAARLRDRLAARGEAHRAGL